MTIDPAAFTHDWIAAWNRRDIEAVLAHCAETVVVVTPKAEAIIGRPEVRGKSELRRTWTSISAGIDHLIYTYDGAFWDPLQRVLTMLYVATIDGVSRRAAEVLAFDADDLIERGEALYGAFIVEDASTADA